jgi:DTW domain-containing protein YfiP
VPELVLLTHATEFDRPTNTGRLVLETGAILADDPVRWQVRAPLWQRKSPDATLLASLKLAKDNLLQPYVLLFPAPDACTIQVDVPYVPSPDIPYFPVGFILLDATWQQAQKMYNQSPYLQALPKWQLQSAQASKYVLRRNQKLQGWCTAELVQLLWQYSGAERAALALTQRFSDFNQR